MDHFLHQDANSHIDHLTDSQPPLYSKSESRGDYLRLFGLDTIADHELIRSYLPPEMFVYYCQKSGLSPAETVLRVAELLKFLILVKNFPGNIIFGKEIDEIWHLWVLQTQEYEALCAALPGGSRRNHSAREYPETPEALEEMMAKVLAASQNKPEDLKPLQADRMAHEEELAHHDTDTPSDATKDSKRYELNAQRILSFFASYYSNFGEIRQEVIPFWPPLRRMMKKLGWDRDKLNAFLAEQVKKSQAKPA